MKINFELLDFFRYLLDCPVRGINVAKKKKKKETDTQTKKLAFEVKCAW